MLCHPWVTNMDERSRNIGAVYDMVGQFAPSRTTQEWIDLMEDADIPVMPVRMLPDLPQDPHTKARQPASSSAWRTHHPTIPPSHRRCHLDNQTSGEVFGHADAARSAARALVNIRSASDR